MIELWRAAVFRSDMNPHPLLPKTVQTKCLVQQGLKQRDGDGVACCFLPYQTNARLLLDGVSKLFSIECM